MADAYRPDPAQLAQAALTDEAAFQVRVVRLAAAHGWRVYHTHDSRRSEPGFPDLVMVRGRRLLFVELKIGRRQTTPEQREWLEALSSVTEVDAFIFRGRADGADDLDGLEAVLRRRAT